MKFPLSTIPTLILTLTLAATTQTRIITLNNTNLIVSNTTDPLPNNTDVPSSNQPPPILPAPRPDQTIGDYFDTLLLLNLTTLNVKPRDLHRTPTHAITTWTSGPTDYNISISRCLHLTDAAGTYTTSSNETLPNATLADIITDLHNRATTLPEARLAYAARVEHNANLAIDEISALLPSAQDPKDLPTDLDDPSLVTPHDEFRHLLAPLTAYIAVILRAATIAETSVAFFAGIAGHSTGYVPESGVLSVAITTFGLHVAEGIRQLAMYGDGRHESDNQARRGLAFVTATIANAFLAWLRTLARAFAGEWLRDAGEVVPLLVGKQGAGDRNLSLGFGGGRKGRGGILPIVGEGALRSVMGRLGDIDEPAARLASWGSVVGGGGGAGGAGGCQGGG